jgi:hypothetical protein
MSNLQKFRSINLRSLTVEAFWCLFFCIYTKSSKGHIFSNSICGVMVSMLASSAVDGGSSPGRDKPDYKIGICCFSTNHSALRRKSEQRLVGLESE